VRFRGMVPARLSFVRHASPVSRPPRGFVAATVCPDPLLSLRGVRHTGVLGVLGSHLLATRFGEVFFGVISANPQAPRGAARLHAGGREATMDSTSREHHLAFPHDVFNIGIVRTTPTALVASPAHLVSAHWGEPSIGQDGGGI